MSQKLLTKVLKVSFHHLYLFRELSELNIVTHDYLVIVHFVSTKIIVNLSPCNI